MMADKISKAIFSTALIIAFVFSPFFLCHSIAAMVGANDARPLPYVLMGITFGDSLSQNLTVVLI